MHRLPDPDVSPVPSSVAWSLPLLLRSPILAHEQPVTRGVPFPRGALIDPAAVALFDDAGREVFVQTQALSRWPDGSVRWLLLDFLVEQIAAGEHCWTLRPRETPAIEQSCVVASRETPEIIFIQTGVAEFQVDRKSLRPFSAVMCGGISLPGFGSRVDLRDVAGTLCRRPPVETSGVETFGAVRTTLCLAGVFPSRHRFLARLCFFAGTGLARLRLTLHNPDAARHRGGLWDLGDKGSQALT